MAPDGPCPLTAAVALFFDGPCIHTDTQPVFFCKAPMPVTTFPPRPLSCCHCYRYCAASLADSTLLIYPSHLDSPHPLQPPRRGPQPTARRQKMPALHRTDAFASWSTPIRCQSGGRAPLWGITDGTHINSANAA
ncbi:hypothetical protein COCCADRAFT_27514 [Bipolaris zeicola 26-R-13]|uniref:Uncharacterized protein n=1 Tax=Cochliobolus carbonum (strain 26-R-13) TaxID=930089 RepID=W6XWM8_COCC2|nr:uncharacterized protein COCCADRAFT_27514 [Bipolaris zeicola 26-R-13]EUC31837.1 hypothetical protein COCCADRAFT_27514 [Bipolaris zeicola 26-R-13]